MQILYKVKPLGCFASALDLLMVPIMWIVSGAPGEVPQQTHFWNNVKFQRSELPFMDPGLMIPVGGSVFASPKYWFGLPLFHIPILGGWKDYVIFTPPISVRVWYIGWIQGDSVGISRIPLDFKGVRVLIGREDVSFFGVDGEGQQIPIFFEDFGRVGDGGWSSKLPLR